MPDDPKKKAEHEQKAAPRKRDPFRNTGPDGFGSKRLTLSFKGPILDLPGESRPPEPEAIEDEPAINEARQTRDGWALDRIARSTLPPASPDALSLADAIRIPRDPRTVTGELPALPEDAEGSALELVDRSRPSQPELKSLRSEMEEHYALGDFTGALQIAELLLGQHATDEGALRCAEKSRAHLVALYTARLGSLRSKPVVIVKDAEVRWLGLDQRAAYILSRIDGATDVSQLIDLSGLAPLEVTKTLVQLLAAGAIAMK